MDDHSASGPPTLYERAGGEDAFVRLIDCFYDRIAYDRIAYDRIEGDGLISPLAPTSYQRHPFPGGAGASPPRTSAEPVTGTDDVGEWASAHHALGYLARADTIAHRAEGEAALLEHVSSPSDGCTTPFSEAIGYSPETEDRSNILLDVQTQLRWLRELGFADVDCHWKWREMALLGGVRPSSPGSRSESPG